MPKSELASRIARKIGWLGASALLVAVVAYIAEFHDTGISGRPEDWEAFGAYIGGAAGTCIGLATLVVLAFSWSQQAQEVEESRYTIHRQTFDSTFFRMLHQFSQISESLHYTTGTAPGKMAMRAMYDSMPFSFSDMDDVKLAIDSMYDSIYRAHEPELGPYFRTLYHIFKFIDRDATLTVDDKVDYANIARAQLSKYELLMIFYNCLTARGVEFKPLIERYGVLKHLNERDLKSPSHKIRPDLYLPTAFMSAEERDEWRLRK